VSLWGYEQHQTQSIKDGHQLVQPDTARAVFKSGHQVHGHPAECRSVINAQTLLMAVRADLVANHSGGAHDLDRRHIEQHSLARGSPMTRGHPVDGSLLTGSFFHISDFQKFEVKPQIN
jgi:hypothetical protein